HRVARYTSPPPLTCVAGGASPCVAAEVVGRHRGSGLLSAAFPVRERKECGFPWGPIAAQHRPPVSTGGPPSPSVCSPRRPPPWPPCRPPPHPPTTPAPRWTA